jgi:hypothetical protein
VLFHTQVKALYIPDIILQIGPISSVEQNIFFKAEIATINITTKTKNPIIFFVLGFCDSHDSSEC